MDWKITLSDLDFGEEERNAVLRIVESGWLTMGQVTEQFEEQFAKMVGVRHAIAVTNGTASLHLACRALDIGPGDEVIVPSLTFVATSNAVLYVGAAPVFVDIESEENLNISAATIEKAITPRTRAIIVMHYGGYPCDMPSIVELAQRHNLFIIEDAAHAPGADINGQKTGSWGHIASFSFFPNKNLTTAEGGMLTTNDDRLAQKMRILRSHGMTTLTWDRHQGHAWSYDVIELGYNYRIDEIRSAIGCEQLKKLPGNNARRNKLTAYYRTLLTEHVPEVTIPFQNFPYLSSCHILPILLPREIPRDRFAELMKTHRIQTSLHYPPIHQFTYYKNNGLAPENPLFWTENVAAREVTIPLYATLLPTDVEYVVQAIRDSLDETLIVLHSTSSQGIELA